MLENSIIYLNMNSILHIRYFYFTILAFAATCSALAPSKSYDHGPINLNVNTTLYFSVNLTSHTVHFALHVSDSSFFSSTDTPAWLGLGIGEPTSGHMPGSDIVTAMFEPSVTTSCQLIDRHVPFAAHPLSLSLPGSASVFPNPDTCQEDGSWVLEHCERNGNGQVLMEVSRSLRAHDTQDRDILPGFQNILHSYGTNFGYHGVRRVSSRIALYNNGTSNDPVAGSTAPLPSDVDGEFFISATNYSVPSDQTTTYACTSKKIPLTEGQRLMVVATEPIYNFSGTAENFNPVHHFLLYLCSSAGYAARFDTTKECSTQQDPYFSGPIGNPEAKCHTLIAAYAKGVSRQVFPKETGIMVTTNDSYLVMEVHYENVGKLPNVRDLSGVKLYTTSSPREHEAGTLMIGDFLLGLFGQKVQSLRKYETTCPSSCLNRLSRPINIFSSFLHMHQTGKEIYTNRFTGQLRFIETINKVNFWNDNFQPATFFDPPKQINPGDTLQTMCMYDTSKREKTTFGLGTENEMCVSILSYWPVQKLDRPEERLNVCAFQPVPERGGDFSFCGDMSSLNNRFTIFEANPAFTDPVGAPTMFGSDVGTCEAESSQEPDVESSPSEEM